MMKKKFEELILELCAKIPRGRITTYKEIAKAVGNQNAVRAVGNALKKNKHPIRIPCHRVVKSNGFVGNYVFGCRKKALLLAKEGIKIENEKIMDFKEKLFRFKKS